ncbi:MAG: hypothetical protein ACREFP_16245 [Acetobacteraceae bacterium]
MKMHGTVLSSALVVGLMFGLQSAGAQADAQTGAGGRTVPSVTGPQHAAAAANAAHEHGGAAEFQIPKVMEMEHEELHADLARVIAAGGKTGKAAKEVATVLDPHFANENSYALPPLGLLVPLSEGKFDCGMAGVLKMTDKLAASMPEMLAEHKEITAALARLAAAAKAENNTEGLRFAEALTAHAAGEEEITYPTALLIGLYVKDKSAGCPH